MFKKSIFWVLAIIVLVSILLNLDLLQTKEKSSDELERQEVITLNAKSELKVPERVKQQNQLDENTSHQSPEDSNDDIPDDDYIVECNSEEIEWDENYENALQEHFHSLSGSNLQDNQLAYALFSKPLDSQSNLDLILEFNDRYPNNPVALLRAISLCTDSLDDKRCNQNLIDNAIASDKDNGAIWLQLMFYHLERNNDSDLQFSIEELVKSSFFNEGYGNNIKLYLQSLKGSSFNNQILNSRSAAYSSMSNLPAYSTIINWCKENSNNSQKSNNCLQLGIMMQNKSKLLLNQAIGMSLQENVYLAEENIELSKKAKTDRDQIMSFIQSDKFRKATALMDMDEGLYWSWMSNFDEFGELKASTLLVEEAILLSKDKNYDPCRT